MKKLSVLEMNRLSVEHFKAASKMPLAIVLDNVRSLYNVGSVFRTADAFRVARICLCGITGTPPLQEIHKTALGAEDSVDWIYHRTTLEAVAELRAEGYEILAVEQVDGSVKLHDWQPSPDRPTALILGNEVKGVDQDVVNRCDNCLEIPQFGTKHSLNVSNTASIVIWQYWYKTRCL